MRLQHGTGEESEAITAGNGFDLDQANLMIHAFERVGVERFQVVLTDIEKRAVEERPRLSPKYLRSILPSRFERCAAEQLNFIIRPRMPQPSYLIQIDDLTAAGVKSIQPHAFMVVETSPGNYQAWLAILHADRDFIERLRRGLGIWLGADLGANGAVRLAGSRNFKPVHAPDYPRVRVTWWSDCAFANLEELERTGLAEPALPTREILAQVTVSQPPNAWPDYGLCLTRANGDRSRADFTWCKIALQKFRWVNQPDRVVAKLEDLSQKAPESHGYARLTVRRALEALLRELAACGDFRV